MVDMEALGMLLWTDSSQRASRFDHPEFLRYTQNDRKNHRYLLKVSLWVHPDDHRWVKIELSPLNVTSWQ